MSGSWADKQGLPENKVGEIQEQSRLKDMQHQNVAHGHWLDPSGRDS